MTLIPDTTSPVTAAAAQLATAIQASSEWSAWKEAQAAFEQDPEVGVLVNQYRALMGKWREARATGGDLDGADAEQWLDVQEKLKNNDLIARREQTTMAMLEMLQGVNRDLSEALGLDFAGSAASKCGGGCCG